MPELDTVHVLISNLIHVDSNYPDITAKTMIELMLQMSVGKSEEYKETSATRALYEAIGKAINHGPILWEATLRGVLLFLAFYKEKHLGAFTMLNLDKGFDRKTVMTLLTKHAELLAARGKEPTPFFNQTMDRFFGGL